MDEAARTTALYDQRSIEHLRDPYAQLATLRSAGPCMVDETTGKWFLLSYDAVQAGLSKIVRGNPEGVDRRKHFPENPFAADGPGHMGPRRVIAPTFTNRGVQRYADTADRIVADILDAKTDGDELRVVSELGFRLPYEMTCEMLGVPQVGNAEELRTWTWRCLELIDAFLSPEQLRINLEAAANLSAHLHEVIEWRKDHLDDDVLSTVIAAANDGRMRPEQVVPYVHTLYLAGMHTTVNQTSLGVWAMLEHPGQWDLLRTKPELMGNAVEELLRFEPTAQYMRRSGVHDAQIGDVTIPAGAEVVCWIASANRDEARFGPSADALDITRADARHHIAFGYGPHACIGSWLARLELHAVLQALIKRFPMSTLPGQDLVWTSNVIRGPEELLVTLNA